MRQTTPAKMLNMNPGLREITHSITGGSIMAQGYWMPYACARAVCATFCHRIAGAMIPLFGPDFPAACIPPRSSDFGRMVIDPAIISASTREAERMRLATRPMTLSSAAAVAAAHPPSTGRRSRRGELTRAGPPPSLRTAMQASLPTGLERLPPVAHLLPPLLPFPALPRLPTLDAVRHDHYGRHGRPIRYDQPPYLSSPSSSDAGSDGDLARRTTITTGPPQATPPGSAQPSPVRHPYTLPPLLRQQQQKQQQQQQQQHQQHQTAALPPSELAAAAVAALARGQLTVDAMDDDDGKTFSSSTCYPSPPILVAVPLPLSSPRRVDSDSSDDSTATTTATDLVAAELLVNFSTQVRMSGSDNEEAEQKLQPEARPRKKRRLEASL
ncbi:apses transcription factor [Grosmannia clavigera kw1407]|uniref:Apses transcription factor n=1 Tax=Grosmannia clavigera (strain kw1407 / UAMH 11150) TaxID=655863 RepID=F0XAE7_GROCL|nr:apses transcription factor [Grosmannia clavigera kw1407]EFX06025.1 apses transcription factor [Grosmannia clavigera kw1407]